MHRCTVTSRVRYGNQVVAWRAADRYRHDVTPTFCARCKGWHLHAAAAAA